ncbi:uncharacterized protein LOC133842608 isoform X1 [Drosophila sulfurigaster albostrigata]|uniref:uncharacterized protein LOC133842608 isoform X1 n=1 Tax=Drosophila sulfurigaster albostrigata TaxID=89887 RepID=UPI002D219AE4|nr:uncharacterized protein LOC133842608 isoform X1 [Drosophila sulfurigaster albostrigata]
MSQLFVKLEEVTSLQTMKYGWIIFVLFQLVLLLSMQPREANGACCRHEDGWCKDGTFATPCCGINQCNMFCCNCRCRSGWRSRNSHGEDSQRSSRRHDHRHTHDRDHHHKHKGRKHSDSCKYTILAMWTSKE